MPLRVFVTGGSGFVGTAVLRELLHRGHEVVALVHRSPLKVQNDRLHSVEGDLFDADRLTPVLKGCDAVIHLVGIIREQPSRGITFERMHVEATKNVIDAAARAGIRRFVHMSAVGARPDAPARYHRTKFAAESHLRASALDWTIFRPSLIHGPGGEFTQMEIGWVRGTAAPFIAMPYFGAGLLGLGRKTLVQPISSADVARAFADALQKPQSIGKTYELGGSERLTWPQMHQAASRIIRGKPRATLPIPSWYAMLLTKVLPGRLLPFNADQVLMAREDNVPDLTAFVRDFGWEPAGFAAAMRTYRDLVAD